MTSEPADAATAEPEHVTPEVADARAAADERASADPRAPTAAQLRRFIKSRPYVPLHELRRRFELNGEADDVRRVAAADGTHYYVGLPEREAELLAQLVRDGDVGVELSRDPRVPIVVGVFAMRPVSRGG